MFQKTLRWSEMLGLFVGGPLLISAFPGVLGGGRLFIFLLFMGGVCGVGLLIDKQFDNKQLWNAKPIKDALGLIIVRWVACSIVLVALFGLLSGTRLPGLTLEVPTGLYRIFRFDDPRMRFLPLLIALFYPWLSVYPQNLIFRAYFCQRYEPILGRGWAMLMINAGAFSFGHFMFNNWVVLLLTFCGGLLFTHTYLKHRSLLLAVIEHALYGIFCFFLGIGVFLLYGASG